MKKIRIVIVDDHPIVLLGTKIFLEKDRTLQVIACLKNYDDLNAFLSENACDIIITDFSIPDSSYDGLNLIDIVHRKFPHIRIVVLTSLKNASLVLKSFDHGATGVIAKGENLMELPIAIKYASQGRKYISPFFRQSSSNTLPSEQAVSLSAKEQEVIRLLSQGLSPQEVSEKLFRSIKTVSWTKMSAKKKLNLKSDAELYAYAQQILKIE